MRVDQDPVRRVPGWMAERTRLGVPAVAVPVSSSWSRRVWSELATIRRLFGRAAR